MRGRHGWPAARRMTTAPRAFRSVRAMTVRWRCAVMPAATSVICAVLQARGLWQTTGWAMGIARNPRRRIAQEPDAEPLKGSAAALAIRRLRVFFQRRRLRFPRPLRPERPDRNQPRARRLPDGLIDAAFFPGNVAPVALGAGSLRTRHRTTPARRQVLLERGSSASRTGQQRATPLRTSRTARKTSPPQFPAIELHME